MRRLLLTASVGLSAPKAGPSGTSVCPRECLRFRGWLGRGLIPFRLILFSLVVLVAPQEVRAQQSGATDFNINSFATTQRRSSVAPNNPGFDPCASDKGFVSGNKCVNADGSATNGLLSTNHFGGAKGPLDANGNPNDTSGGVFVAMGAGAVTDNMFGVISDPTRCNQNPDASSACSVTILKTADPRTGFLSGNRDPLKCGDPFDSVSSTGHDEGINTGVNCGFLRFNPSRAGMSIPPLVGANSLVTIRFPMHRTLSLDFKAEDSDPATPDRNNFCGTTATPCQSPIQISGIQPGFSNGFAFRRSSDVNGSVRADLSCTIDFTNKVVTTDGTAGSKHICAEMGLIQETQLGVNEIDQHVELFIRWKTSNLDNAGVIEPAEVSPLICFKPLNVSACTSGDVSNARKSDILVVWKMHITDPDMSGAGFAFEQTVDSAQPAGFFVDDPATTTNESTLPARDGFSYCIGNVGSAPECNFPKVTFVTGKSQTNGDPDSTLP